MIIEFKDKKHSSGRIRGGEIVLYISSRLSRAEQQRHIAILTQRLEAQLARPRPPEPAVAQLPRNEATTDAAIAAWARELNARYYGFTMASVHYRRQNSRWGSCSGLTRNIYLSHRLKDAPKVLVEYVLVHELCHLQEMNHGARFWRLVARGCPDYRQRRALLHQWGRWLDAGDRSRED